jgi:hypothetical protein
MMIHDIEKNELTEAEMDNVSGGFMSPEQKREYKNHHEFDKVVKKAEAAKKAKEEAGKIVIHEDGGVSGGW